MMSFFQTNLSQYAEVTSPVKTHHASKPKTHVVSGKVFKDKFTHSAEHRSNISAAKKGKPVSDEHRAKIAAALTGRKRPEELCLKIRGLRRSKETCELMTAVRGTPVMTPNGVFPSVRAVAEAAGRGHDTIRKWMKWWPSDYYYLDIPVNRRKKEAL
jgi:plasmid stability protein